MGRSFYPRALSYGVAFASVLLGVLILSGILYFGPTPSVRYTFGIVLVLMGVYRFLVTMLNLPRARRKNHDE